MKVTHILTISARCPVDISVEDTYEMIVKTERLIEVETILAEALDACKEPVYQETLCDDLSKRLGCEVTLIGVHSGVKTEVTCGV